MALPNAGSAQIYAEGEPPITYGDDVGEQGNLMGDITTPEGQKKVAKAVLKLWESRAAYMQQLLAQWKLNVARRKGITSGKLTYDTGDDVYDVWFPPDASPDMVPDANEAANLCRKFPSIMFNDPPAPQVEPPSGDNADEDAAEFSTRALVDLQGESRLKTVHKCRQAFDKASDYGSGFIYYFVDDKGGGRQPIRVIARADAQTFETALVNPATDFEEGPYVTRYVRADGSLTDNEGEAATKWAPDIRSEVVTGRNVRPIPYTADSIDECHGIQIGVFTPYGVLRKRFQVLENYPEDEEKKLFQFKPENWEMLRNDNERRTSRLEQDDKDSRPVWVTTTIYEQCPDYEDGLFLITLGDCVVAYRGSWSFAGKRMKEKLILPIAQVAQWEEGRDGFFKVGSMEILGGPNEVRSAQLATQLDWLDKMNNQKIFLPIHSVLDPKQLQFSRATVLYINPGGEPQYQNLPPYPRESIEMRDTMTGEMRNAIGLQETGSGLESASVNSGRQAMTILAQVHAALSEPRQFIESGYLRCCRIELQMARAFLPQPQRWHMVGDDSGYKEVEWSTSDLLTTADIHLRPGSLSMLAAPVKAQLTEHMYLNLKLLSPQEAKEMMATNLSGVLGLEDDPFRMRIRRQIAAWSKGPPQGWMEQRQQQAMQAQMQPPPTMAVMGGVPAPPVPPGPPPVVQQDPMTGQPIILDPVLKSIWEPIRCDTLPNIAAIRVAELAKLMASTKYSRWPTEWRAAVDAEYDRMLIAQQPPQPQPNQPPQPGQPGRPGIMGMPGQSGRPAPTPMEQQAETLRQAGIRNVPEQPAA